MKKNDFIPGKWLIPRLKAKKQVNAKIVKTEK